jgi:hypothetical protein
LYEVTELLIVEVVISVMIEIKVVLPLDGHWSYFATRGNGTVNYPFTAK